MANNKQRYVNTRFWNDGYVSELDPIEKLLFIYFITNEHTNISGVYELPLKVVAMETGIDKSMIEKILPRLSDKIGYVKGYVVVKNFIKHQETGSDLVKKGIVNCLKDLDKDFLEMIVNKGFYAVDRYYIDTLSIQYTKVLNYSDLDSDLDSDSSKGTLQEIPILIKSFEGINPTAKNWYGNTTQRKACQDLIETYSFQRVKDVIDKTLPRTNKIQYFPTITTPLQLRDKWASLESAIIKYQSEKINKDNKYKVAFAS